MRLRFARKPLLPCLRGVGLAVSALAAAVLAPGPAAAAETKIEPSAFRVVERDSGPVNYYSVLTEEGVTFLRARYRPPLKTVVLGWQASKEQRRPLSLSWKWRARQLPAGGDECRDGKGDSAAVVYVTWKRGLRYYTLKYVWSAVGKKGQVCDRKRNPFVAQDTIILDSGPPLDTWKTVRLDLPAQFRSRFEDGDASAEVPDFAGVGVMSDGDQTRSESAADYRDFTLVF
ncbi:MAG TPA: DUF3047 domain-containing protein [Polyangiaceae bacterium]